MSSSSAANASAPVSDLRKRRAEAMAVSDDDDGGVAADRKQSSPKQASASASASAASASASAPVSAAAKARAKRGPKPYKRMTVPEREAYLRTEVDGALRDRYHPLRRDASHDMDNLKELNSKRCRELEAKLRAASDSGDSAAVQQCAIAIKKLRQTHKAAQTAYDSRVNRAYLTGVLRMKLERGEYNKDESSSSSDDDDDDAKHTGDTTQSERDVGAVDVKDDSESSSSDDEDAVGDVAAGQPSASGDQKKAVIKTLAQVADKEQAADRELESCADAAQISEKAVRVSLSLIVRVALQIWSLAEPGNLAVCDVEIPKSESLPVRARDSDGLPSDTLSRSEFRAARRGMSLMIQLLSQLNEFVTPGLDNRIAFDDILTPLRAARALYIATDCANDRVAMASDPARFGRVQELIFAIRLGTIRVALATSCPQLVVKLSKDSKAAAGCHQLVDLIAGYALPHFMPVYCLEGVVTPDALRATEEQDVSVQKAELAQLCAKTGGVPRERHDPEVFLERILPQLLLEEMNGRAAKLAAILKLPANPSTVGLITRARAPAMALLRDFQFRRRYFADETLRLMEQQKEMKQRYGLCPPEQTAEESVDDPDQIEAIKLRVKAMDGLNKLLADINTGRMDLSAGLDAKAQQLLCTAIPVRFVTQLARVIKVPSFHSLAASSHTGGAAAADGAKLSTDVEFYEPSALYEHEAKAHDEVLRKEDAAECIQHAAERRARKRQSSSCYMTEEEQAVAMRDAIQSIKRRRTQPSEVRDMVIDDDAAGDDTRGVDADGDCDMDAVGGDDEDL
jgi:hypothetical protein